LAISPWTNAAILNHRISRGNYENAPPRENFEYLLKETTRKKSSLTMDSARSFTPLAGVQIVGAFPPQTNGT
jgi:hypothetical protein